jgi:hypothetical protein
MRGLVAEVLARPAWEREAILDRLSGADISLRAELAALVRQHEQADPAAPTQELPPRPSRPAKPTARRGSRVRARGSGRTS